MGGNDGAGDETGRPSGQYPALPEDEARLPAASEDVRQEHVGRGRNRGLRAAIARPESGGGSLTKRKTTDVRSSGPPGAHLAEENARASSALGAEGGAEAAPRKIG